MAKKAAAKKKSTKSEPAKKAGTAKTPTKKKAAAGGKKTAKKAPAGTAITEQDLAQVYARAWADEAFRTLLETDPTAALQQYAADNGLRWTKLVKLPAAPRAGEEQDENCIHLVSCC